VVAAIAVVVGCASNNNTNAPTATPGTSGAQVEIGNTINFGSFGITADVDCVYGKSLNVGGSDNTLTVKGACADLRVGGSNNTITLNQVDKLISVAGTNNKITFTAGEPKVEKLGESNQITKG
jgi:Protein of unknown function (DUF3060)